MKPEAILPDRAGAKAADIGAALRTRRKALGITMAAAAEAAGISRVTWHRLEKGEPTVAWGSLQAAATALGLALLLRDPDVPLHAAGFAKPGDRSLPLRIRLDEYPQLRQLAWQVADGAQELAPREALALYERNWRHVDQAALETAERDLLDALREVFGSVAPDV